MREELILNLCDKSYKKGTRDSLSLNLVDLKMIKSALDRGSNKMAMSTLENLIDFFETNIAKKDQQLNALNQERDELFKGEL